MACPRRPLPSFLACCALATALAAGAGPSSPASAEEHAIAADPATVLVEKGPFTTWLDVKGVFEPRDAVEVSYRAEAYGGELRVAKSVGEGPVEAGAVLLQLETDRIDEQLGAQGADVALAKKALERQVEESRRAEESSRVALAREEAEAKNAGEAYAWFLEVEKPLRIREADHRLQGARDGISDQEEELAQLKKMYQADELVEETEEIVLKRAERQLARSKASFEFSATRTKHAIEVDLAKDEAALALSKRKEDVELDRAKATFEIAVEQNRLEVEKARLGLARQEAALDRLRRDRESLTVKAPVAGVAVPGTCVRGKWSGPEDAARAIRPGATVKPDQVLYTIVQPGVVGVRASVAESMVADVRVGMYATVQPVAAKDVRLDAKVSRIARVSSDDKFDVVLDLAKVDERWLPGYAVKVKTKVKEEQDVVSVPAGSVVTDGEKKVVHVFADGKSTPREVETGATSAGRIAITKGLEAGERVLRDPPKPQ